ncbi:MAG: flagellar basal body rod protein FlgB [Bacteriovoracaceae bacterium]|nr:flagellar basal body rod protein FlgB [Bacteriovoracaceae bacterium]
MEITDKTANALAAAIKFREMKQKIISSNIANADTPEYKAKTMDFEESLGRALDVDGKMSITTTNDRHFNVGSGGFAGLEPEIYDDPNGIQSDDGNTVDMEKELANMADNKIQYDAAVNLLNKKLALMKYTLNTEK